VYYSVDTLTCVQESCLSLVSVLRLESRLESCCSLAYSTAFVGTWRHRRWISQLLLIYASSLTLPFVKSFRLQATAVFYLASVFLVLYHHHAFCNFAVILNIIAVIAFHRGLDVGLTPNCSVVDISARYRPLIRRSRRANMPYWRWQAVCSLAELHNVLHAGHAAAQKTRLDVLRTLMRYAPPGIDSIASPSYHQQQRHLLYFH